MQLAAQPFRQKLAAWHGWCSAPRGRISISRFPCCSSWEPPAITQCSGLEKPSELLKLASEARCRPRGERQKIRPALRLACRSCFSRKLEAHADSKLHETAIAGIECRIHEGAPGSQVPVAQINSG